MESDKSLDAQSIGREASDISSDMLRYDELVGQLNDIGTRVNGPDGFSDPDIMDLIRGFERSANLAVNEMKRIKREIQDMAERTEQYVVTDRAWEKPGTKKPVIPSIEEGWDV
jgi:hypothetical protein